MRRFIILICFLAANYAHAQRFPDLGIVKVHLTESDKVIVAEIAPISNPPKAKSNLYYHWYSANAIYQTQGGYSGTLLNGLYTEFYLNKNLKEQGFFKNGLKNKVWKSWNEDGTLSQSVVWKNGVIVLAKSKPFWKKLNIFKKKSKITLSDTLAKPINKPNSFITH